MKKQRKDNNTNTRRRRYEGVKFVHDKEPNFRDRKLEIPDEVCEKIENRLSFLYGTKTAKVYMKEIERICRIYYAHKTEKMIEIEKTFDPKERFTEEDVILITYGDLIREENVSPLTTLSKFCGIYLKQAINTLHILPFFPYSSDRGFSVIDFESVDPKLGTWEDLEDLETRYKLMFDGVINHVSSKSRWFREFLNGNAHYKDFFISYDSPEELTARERALIFRPRTSDVLSKFQTINGEKYVWTTFSNDQIDLNFKNPDVLIRVLEILLYYVRKGADIIRLDAVTYLWADPGTSCANLTQTHLFVKLFNDVLKLVAPHVAILTETNIPHNANISYFGTGMDEAQMVYNFALPPLVLHSFYTRNATKLTEWASNLKLKSETTTFFNFLDSHDGVGLAAVKDILSKDEINFLIQRAREHGGYISYKADKEGRDVPYELNITWFSALNREDGTEHQDQQINKFLASRAIALVLQGVPGIYLHSFFGTKNDINMMLETDTRREINRTVVDYKTLVKALDNPATLTAKICRKLISLISIRTTESSFNPNGAQQVLKTAPELFVVLRSSPYDDQHILSIINVTEKKIDCKIPMEKVSIFKSEWYDLISEKMYVFNDRNINITLKPYDIVWLEPQ
ncbi:MAG: sugar phosphorylase [Candidatus Anammoxibacter sp.]